MNEELKKLLNQQKALLDKAKAEGRVPSLMKERTFWNDLQAKINAAKEQIEAEKSSFKQSKFS